MTLARSLPGTVPLEVFVRVVLLIVFAAVAVYYLLDRKQSFTLYVHTRLATVELTGSSQQTWYLSRATLCQRATGEGTSDSPQCAAPYYNSFEGEEVEVTWQEGVTLTLRGMDETSFITEITVPDPEAEPPYFDDTPITDKSLIIFDRRSLLDSGALVLTGELTVGASPESGATHLLQGGRYEIRESLRLSSGPSVVATGTFLPGDTLTLEDATGTPVPLQMLISPPRNAGSDFDIVATSPPRKSAIVLQRIGTAKTRISSRWMDRLANDALPLALSIFLGLLGASLGIAKSLVGAGPRDKNQ